MRNSASRGATNRQSEHKPTGRAKQRQPTSQLATSARKLPGRWSTSCRSRYPGRTGRSEQASETASSTCQEESTDRLRSKAAAETTKTLRLGYSGSRNPPVSSYRYGSGKFGDLTESGSLDGWRSPGEDQQRGQNVPGPQRFPELSDASTGRIMVCFRGVRSVGDLGGQKS
jgi:hypothetical protein